MRLEMPSKMDYKLFPYFGGKSHIAHVVWSYIGAEVEHYLEPFFGSGAVLFARPGFAPTKAWYSKHTETVNDKDGFVCNVWRALKFAPDEVAKWCDWPLNHADLIARKKELIEKENWLLENLINDPKWYDAELAGYWIYQQCGGIAVPLKSVNQMPILSYKGTGIFKVTKIGNIYEWFKLISERIRYVRVVCSDWSRICGGNWRDSNWSTVGMFFDPPYSVKDRSSGVYLDDSQSVAKEAVKWCIEQGKKSNHRIVFCGYEDEHPELIEAGWKVYSWKYEGGYCNTVKGLTQGKINRFREVLYISPFCKVNKMFQKSIK